MQEMNPAFNADKKFHFTDEQWRALTKYIAIDIAAQARIEECVGLYCDFKRGLSGQPTPSENTKQLEQMQEAASQLARAFNNMKNNQLMCLLDSYGTGLRVHGLEKIEQTKAVLEYLPRWLERAIERSRHDKKPTGPDSGNEDFLVACLNTIFLQFANRELSRSKVDVAFVELVFQHAGYSIGTQSIEASIRRLDKKDTPEQAA